jgi:hypothetical protein
MVEWFFLAQSWFALGAGLLLVLMGLVGRIPSGFSISLVAISELALVIQLSLSIVLVFMGEQAKVDTWEFFGYLLVALMIPAGGAIWALLERGKWSTVVMGAALLTLSVMLVRMWQIWSGETVNFDS